MRTLCSFFNGRDFLLYEFLCNKKPPEKLFCILEKNGGWKDEEKLVVVLLTAAMSMSLLAGCGGNSGSSDAKSDAKTEDTKEDSDQVAADKVAKLIDDIYVQERTDKTDEQVQRS